VWTDRFVDPRLCEAQGGAQVLARPHDVASDWFAFAAMACRTLLGVGPYGGVFQPADPARRVAPAQRPRLGITIFDDEVVYPRAATPWQALPDEFVAQLRATFAAGARGAFPEALLASLRFRACAGCGLEHARSRCPRCAVQVAVPVVVHGGVRVTPIDPRLAPRTTWPVGERVGPGAPPVLRRGDGVYRLTARGEELIGTVVGGEARLWASARGGVGFYRVGALTVGVSFDVERGGLADALRLPPIVGTLVTADAAIADDHAWLGWRTEQRGRLTTTIVLVVAGAVRAIHVGDGDDWMAGFPGACAVGTALLVPTDAGIVRVEASGGALTVTRTFTATAELCTAADALALAPRGLAIHRHATTVQVEL